MSIDKHAHRLIKSHLNFDGENYEFSHNEIKNISATHGASVESAVELLSAGKFVNRYLLGEKYDQEFYLTPNPRYGYDVDKLEGDFDPAEFSDIDAILSAIEYAGSSDIQSYRDYGYDGHYEQENNGVVITLGTISLENAFIHLDKENAVEGSNGIELVLPKAPSFSSIRGIYPIDQRSATALESLL